MTAIATGRATDEAAETRAWLRRFLNTYWLRPENAFWMTLRSQTLSRVPLDEPSADISCGDGVFSFIHAGGEFSIDFDVFGAVARLDRVRSEHADIFDHVDETYRPDVVRAPDRRISVGTDWKQALLDKAATLDFYDRLVAHDNNKPLPFEDASFVTVYCNSIYWVTAIDPFLKEVRRILRPGGRAVFQVKLDAMCRYTLADHRERLGQAWLDLIGRGRFETWPTLGDQAAWENRFAAAGFSITAARPFITRTHAHIWDIGLRPIAPLLIRMANQLTPENRRAIKADWVDLMTDLLIPITRTDFDLFPDSHPPAEIQLELQAC